MTWQLEEKLTTSVFTVLRLRRVPRLFVCVCACAFDKINTNLYLKWLVEMRN